MVCRKAIHQKPHAGNKRLFLCFIWQTWKLLTPREHFKRLLMNQSHRSLHSAAQIMFELLEEYKVGKSSLCFWKHIMMPFFHFRIEAWGCSLLTCRQGLAKPSQRRALLTFSALTRFVKVSPMPSHLSRDYDIDENICFETKCYTRVDSTYAFVISTF